MLLQMPLLFALFIVFRSTIQLRGQPFILWITDLSRPDTLHLGMNLPFLGESIHVLPILMALTMIWQSKMTVTDPKQKFMVYFMPLFMVFIFYSLPSGLNLYYSVFNVLSMFQTRMIKKKMHPDNSGEAEKEKQVVAKEKPKSVASGKKKSRRR
jgi:YidC/Oxa1 family membrane protein insertase